MINPGAGAIDTAPHPTVVTRDKTPSSPGQSLHVYVHGPGDVRPKVVLEFPKGLRSEKDDCGVCRIHDQFMSVKEISDLRRFRKLSPPWRSFPGVVGAPNVNKRAALESGDASVEDIGIGRRDGQFDPPRAPNEAGPRAIDRGPFF